ncbi:MAG: hypothetical protein A2W22_04705 [Candidatus Levybacteria bacterium RBG_16_35_11]|nr:MAG: hypothetical protein A2W22_04705 [Candidatus Levybacteria bacterium RBG_16_35_11]
MTKKKIVLASKSPRRKELLKQIGLNFTVDISEIDERRFSHSSPLNLVKNLAKAKARIISKKHKDAIIIAADTLVVLNKEIIGKPKSKRDAMQMLKKLNGKTHLVITGFTILDSKKEITEIVKTKVKFKKMTKKEIDDYVKTGEPLDKAGGYGIQGKGAIFIEGIKGDFFNVVGLPIYALSKALERSGVDVSSYWL